MTEATTFTFGVLVKRRAGFNEVIKDFAVKIFWKINLCIFFLFIYLFIYM
jgi:hypothetical protein